MKIFLSALENAQTSIKDSNGKSIDLAHYLKQHEIPMKWNLCSYFYCRGAKQTLAEYIRDNSELMLIDSGAHSFQKGVKVDWDKYTDNYAEFIRQYDRDNVVGFFEMDVDNVIGYDHVLFLRKKLERVSDKIIPVWHKNRGIDEYKRMCEEYSGKIVAITGFKNEDIQDHQYLMFLKYAKSCDCKVHCLGMTRRKVLDKVPFDYTDSSTWKQKAIRGHIGDRGKVTKEFTRYKREIVDSENYKEGLKMQEHYYAKWQKICRD